MMDFTRDSEATDTKTPALAGVKISADKRRGKPKGTGSPTTSDSIYTSEEQAFLAAIEGFKAKSGKKFPTWADVLKVVKDLGYEQTA